MKYFVTYGDKLFKESVNLIKLQARKSNFFDKVISYNQEDLPLYIRSSPLFAFKKGGGYWVWKPFIIKDLLSKCNEGDIIYYVDSGCTLNTNSKEWSFYDKIIANHNAIFFQYRDDFEYKSWIKYCSNKDNLSCKLRYWIKPTTAKYFNSFFGNNNYLNFNKIMGGFFIIKKSKSSLRVIEDWFNITLFHPELIADPYGAELENLCDEFNCHRHDQCIITPLVFHYKELDNILVLPESSESQKDKAAVIASRNKLGKIPFLLKLKYRIYYYLK